MTRREATVGKWQDMATAPVTETTLIEQLRGVDLKYCITAINKAGESKECNTVAVLL